MTNPRKTQLRRPHTIQNPAFVKKAGFFWAAASMAFQRYWGAKLENRLSDNHNHLAGGDLRVFLNPDFLNNTVHGTGDIIFHFHGFHGR